MRRILEGLSDLAGRSMTPQDMAEALRPALSPLLIQQIAPLNAPLPLITLTPDLEQLLARSRQQAPDAPLIVDNQLAENILVSLNQISEELAAQGRQPIVVVAGALRRAFASFLKGNQSDAIVLAINELPDNRRIEVVATVGAAQNADANGDAS